MRTDFFFFCCSVFFAIFLFQFFWLGFFCQANKVTSGQAVSHLPWGSSHLADVSMDDAQHGL